MSIIKTQKLEATPAPIEYTKSLSEKLRETGLRIPLGLARSSNRTADNAADGLSIYSVESARHHVTETLAAGRAEKLDN